MTVSNVIAYTTIGGFKLCDSDNDSDSDDDSDSDEDSNSDDNSAKLNTTYI